MIGPNVLEWLTARLHRPPYLEGSRAKPLVAAATELTYREPLADVLRTAAEELGFGADIGLDQSRPALRRRAERFERTTVFAAPRT